MIDYLYELVNKLKGGTVPPRACYLNRYEDKGDDILSPRVMECFLMSILPWMSPPDDLELWDLSLTPRKSHPVESIKMVKVRYVAADAKTGFSALQSSIYLYVSTPGLGLRSI